MATVPAVPKFSQYNFALGDTAEAITKQNGQNAALVTFGNSLRTMTQSLNDDIAQVDSDKAAAAQSASDALTYRDQTQEITEGGLPPKSGNAGLTLRVSADETRYELGGTMPAGMVVGFPATKAPVGWLKVNGASLSRISYADLWAFAQASGNLATSESSKGDLEFGPGDGSSTFSLPDHRGEFLRWWDDGRGVDSGRGIGDRQGSQNKAHNHGGKAKYGGYHDHGSSVTSSGGHRHSGNTGYDGNHKHSSTKKIRTVGSGDYGIADFGASWDNGSTYFGSIMKSAGNHRHSFSTSYESDHTHSVNVHAGGEHDHGIDSDGGSESRPRNMPLLACIRY